jgi:hypothetical protein
MREFYSSSSSSLPFVTSIYSFLTSMVCDRPQWSYKKGLATGVLPAKAYEKSFDCTGSIPSFSDLPEYY